MYHWVSASPMQCPNRGRSSSDSDVGGSVPQLNPHNGLAYSRCFVIFFCQQHRSMTAPFFWARCYTSTLNSGTGVVLPETSDIPMAILGGGYYKCSFPFSFKMPICFDSPKLEVLFCRWETPQVHCFNINVTQDALAAACQVASRSIDQLIWQAPHDVARAVTLFGPGVVVLPMLGSLEWKGWHWWI